MTSYQVIYDAFLGQMTTDEWESWLEDEATMDWKNLLNAALPRFKFPRVDLSQRDEEGFLDSSFSNDEAQILAAFMKCEWLSRSILSWENTRSLYDERDFSPANRIDKLTNLLKVNEEMAKERESNYYRSIKGKPFDYSKLAGKGKFKGGSDNG